MKTQPNDSWLTALKLSGSQQNRPHTFVIMPYRGISFGQALMPVNSFNGAITHYLHVHRSQNASRPGVLYPSADTYLVFCQDADSRDRSFLVGPRSFPRIGEYVTNNTKYFVVGLSQTGSYAFLPLDQNELTDRAFPLDTAFKWARELTDKINAVDATTTKIHIFEQFMCGYIDKLNFSRHDSANKINNLSTGDDYKYISCYLKSLNYTERHTRRLFLKYIGIPPKKFMQIVRCQTALKFMLSKPTCPLTDIAYQLDYYDQAHFINEFKSFYNSTPLQFAKEFLS